MPAVLADALVLAFTRGVSLRTWIETGGIERELALYRRLAPYFGRIVLVTYGGPNEETLLIRHGADAFNIVCNKERLSLPEYSAALPGLVERAVGDASRIIIKTNQMCGGAEGAAIAAHLRSKRKTVALVARGGYLWSRMTAYEHGHDSDQARGAAAEEAVVLGAADIMVGTTQEMIDDQCWRYGFPARRARVIPNYVLVGSGEARAAAQREAGLILYAGQLVRRKRVDVLIDAVAGLPEEVRLFAKLEVIGSGPERDSLVARARQLEAPVTFRERVPHAELLERMNHCAIYVQAAEMEGHPKTVLEAMAAGAAVIVANTPGLAGTVTHGVTGLRIENTPEAFSQAIGELLADSEWRDMLGGGAARSARATLSLDSVVPKELEAYEAAMQHASAPAIARRAG